jgi:tripartite-type tricarboxylate transporter receptor subunit TctC
MHKLRVLLFALLFVVSSLATAQTAAWPAKPVKILVGASPAAAPTSSRACSPTSTRRPSASPFVVENRPGAANTIASDVTAKAPPDGYTLLVGTNTAQAIAPHLMKLGFDPNKDLAPIALIVVVPNVIAVAPTVAATNVKELVDGLKANPGTYSCGSSGIGSTQHLACAAFALATGTKIVHVPYKGSAQALTDLVGGQIQLDFDTTSSAMSFIKSGKVKALAVMTPRRSSELPEVPTLAEAGYPNVEMSTWYGLFTTAGVPADIQAKLHAETMRILAMPDVRKRLEGLAGEPGTLTAAQFAAMARADYERSGKLVKDADIKPEQ